MWYKRPNIFFIYVITAVYLRNYISGWYVHVGMPSVTQKVPGGKLLCISVCFDSQKIDTLRITGDFFMYPETALERLEEHLKGADHRSVGEITEAFLVDQGVELLGFSPQDLLELVEKAWTEEQR